MNLGLQCVPTVRGAARSALLGCCLMICSAIEANSRGGGAGKDDPWDAHHIDGLPADIRQYIATICKGPSAAQHDFATYAPQEKRWRINLEYLRCNGLSNYRHDNQCLDVDFVEIGSHFRLARKQYRDCGF
ncbi:hypothetical protein [Bradyrhizobium diazoefficiens]|uniref:hypothetical protein n=1 Tax=Bradyrhizobium diazoefficiens TaxID=1355477 RepID=UPI0034776C23